MDVHYSSKSNEWETPPELFNEYDSQFGFTLDAAATKENSLCANYYTIEDDGLAQDWSLHSFVWLNPPYGREIGKWIEKAFHESQKGATVVCLVPARTDTKYFHDFCFKGEVRFLRGRLKFSGSKSSAPFPSAIVIFRPEKKQVRQPLVYPAAEPFKLSKIEAAF